MIFRRSNEKLQTLDPIFDLYS